MSSFIPSANGKKASDAATLPIIPLLKIWEAFSQAILLEANLLVCPAPVSYTHLTLPTSDLV